MARSQPDPPGYEVGGIYRTPDGPAIYLGLAAYEVQGIGMDASRRYVWIDPQTKVAVTVEGPLAFERLGKRGIVGFVRDRLPAVPQEVRRR